MSVPRDVDVQVDVEIHGGSLDAAQLERALYEVDFRADTERVWRWQDQSAPAMAVEVEFLADLDDKPAQATTLFDDCESLGAVNLRGTGFAAKDWEFRPITPNLGAGLSTVDVGWRPCRRISWRRFMPRAQPGEGLVRRAIRPHPQQRRRWASRPPERGADWLPIRRDAGRRCVGYAPTARHRSSPRAGRGIRQSLDSPTSIPPTSTTPSRSDDLRHRRWTTWSP